MCPPGLDHFTLYFLPRHSNSRSSDFKKVPLTRSTFPQWYLGMKSYNSMVFEYGFSLGSSNSNSSNWIGLSCLYCESFLLFAKSVFPFADVFLTGSSVSTNSNLMLPFFFCRAI